MLCLCYNLPYIRRLHTQVWNKKRSVTILNIQLRIWLFSGCIDSELPIEIMSLLIRFNTEMKCYEPRWDSDKAGNKEMPAYIVLF